MQSKVKKIYPTVNTVITTEVYKSTLFSIFKIDSITQGMSDNPLRMCRAQSSQIKHFVPADFISDFNRTEFEKINFPPKCPE